MDKIKHLWKFAGKIPRKEVCIQLYCTPMPELNSLDISEKIYFLLLPHVEICISKNLIISKLYEKKFPFFASKE